MSFRSICVPWESPPPLREIYRVETLVRRRTSQTVSASDLRLVSPSSTRGGRGSLVHSPSWKRGTWEAEGISDVLVGVRLGTRVSETGPLTDSPVVVDTSDGTSLPLE